jgi:hypothetical protein
MLINKDHIAYSLTNSAVFKNTIFGHLLTTIRAHLYKCASFSLLAFLFKSSKGLHAKRTHCFERLLRGCLETAFSQRNVHEALFAEPDFFPLCDGGIRQCFWGCLVDVLSSACF